MSAQNDQAIPEVGDTPHSKVSIRIKTNDYGRILNIMAYYMQNEGIRYCFHDTLTKILDRWAISEMVDIEKRKI